MSTPVSTVADIEGLAARYAGLREPENQTPAQVLRNFQRDIDKTVLPCITSLDRRSRGIYDALCEFADRAVKEDRKPTDAIVEDTKRAERTAKEIDKEAKQLFRELTDTSPCSPRQKVIMKVLDLRKSELELLTRRVEENERRIRASKDKIGHLIPPTAKVLNRVEGLETTFLKLLSRLAKVGITAKLILTLPVFIAFVTTLVLDRITPAMERLTHTLVPNDYHDVVLLALFALQILLLTPVTDAISAKLCWKNFDHTLLILRSQLRELRDIEARIMEAEQQVPALFSKLSQPHDT